MATDQKTKPDASFNATIPENALDFLIKLIPDNFGGDRYKNRSLIKQVVGVFELAKPTQKTPLMQISKVVKSLVKQENK